MSLRRRDFLKATAAVAAPWFVPAHVFASADQPGANDRVKVGFAGLGGRAGWIFENEDLPGGQIVAVADCFTRRCDEKLGMIASKHPEWRPRKYADIRPMLDKEKLDAVFVETTCHARVWCMMHALAAGVDVYGEKPLTLTVAEGRLLATPCGSTIVFFKPAPSSARCPSTPIAANWCARERSARSGK